MTNAVRGSSHPRSDSTVSWGAIIAGVVTFRALTLVLSLVSAAMGLTGASGAATGVWTVIALAIALGAAGYVAGALATRTGLFHGFLTWATSLLAVLVPAGWPGASALGTAGNVLGTASSPARSTSTAARATTKRGSPS